MNLSGGPFTFNRFDEYESRLEEGLDPVGKEDSDVDNDGDVDKSDGYLKNRRKAIGRSMGKASKKNNPKDVEEGLNNNEIEGSIMDGSEQRMAMYSRALGIMGAHYSGQPSGDVEEIEEGMMGGEGPGGGGDKKEMVKAMIKKKMMAKKAQGMQEGMMGDEGPGGGGGGDKKEMVKSIIKKKMMQKKAQGMQECIDMEDVCNYLVSEGYVNNIVSAEVMFNHISDDFLVDIEDLMEEEFLEEGMADQGVDGDEAMKRHGIKQHEGPMKVKKLKARGMRKGEGLGVGARKRQGAGKVNMANPSDHNPKARNQ